VSAAVCAIVGAVRMHRTALHMSVLNTAAVVFSVHPKLVCFLLLPTCICKHMLHLRYRTASLLLLLLLLFLLLLQHCSTHTHLYISPLQQL
jgi:hypothetical protein